MAGSYILSSDNTTTNNSIYEIAWVHSLIYSWLDDTVCGNYQSKDFMI